ncbi:hypothetical protein [Pelotomaculum propionicicum]|uniref:Uncharacterized protein n=1 Tax=Pelotomaculum propionicicum TaxID=258475 RepID=A0A4Y7RW67_9FIRM|nr:hypothetical protein [Pelotomaculum propionicicum]TEB13103.1 hypothetical protein Pmgp_00399 [Pelotomaculum propionicicum]
MVDWERAYRLLDQVTPLAVDCGLLCGGICCAEWEKGGACTCCRVKKSCLTGTRSG